MMRRRLMMGQAGGGPYDSKVDYIEATGNQYIDTGFTPVLGDEIYAEFFHRTIVTGILYSLLSAGTGNSQTIFLAGTATQGAYVRVFSTGSAVPVRYNFNEGHWRYLTITGSGDISVELEGGGMSTAHIDPTTELDGAATTLWLFKRRNDTSPFLGGLRKFRISRNGNLVLDLEAVRLGSVGYMYDNVSGSFLGNAGTGDFVVGNDIN